MYDRDCRQKTHGQYLLQKWCRLDSQSEKNIFTKDNAIAGREAQQYGCDSDDCGGEEAWVTVSKFEIDLSTWCNYGQI